MVSTKNVKTESLTQNLQGIRVSQPLGVPYEMQWPLSLAV